MAAPRAKVEELSGFQKAIIWAGSQLIRLLCLTYRYQFTDESGFLGPAYPLEPVVILMWHNRILAMPMLFGRYYPKRKRKGLLVLTSASRDGAFLSAFVGNFGMGSVRGSSSRRGAAALLDLTRKLREGYDVCFTPDGPRGPKYKLSAGPILIAQKCDAPLVLVHIDYHSCWRLKSWDAFAIPKPFSRVVTTLLPLVRVSATGSEEDFERERLRIEEMMMKRMVFP